LDLRLYDISKLVDQYHMVHTATVAASFVMLRINLVAAFLGHYYALKTLSFSASANIQSTVTAQRSHANIT
jgi:hypothetical protein